MQVPDMDATGIGTLAAIVGSSFVVGLSGAVMPGSVLTVTIAQAARRGAQAGLLVSTGHALVELALFLLLVAGAAALITAPLPAALIAICGALVLIWMSWGMLAEARITSGLPAPGEEPRPALGPVGSGMLASVSNPYWFLWWATAGVGYLTYARSSGNAGIGAFFIGHILADYVWLTFVAAAIAGGRRVLTAAAYRWLLRILAWFLLILAIGFIVFGATKLIGLRA